MNLRDRPVSGGNKREGGSADGRGRHERRETREGSRHDRVKDGKDRGSESDKERRTGRETEPR